MHARQFAVYAILAVYGLASLGHVHDLVLCIEGDGRMAIKAASAECCSDAPSDASSSADVRREVATSPGTCASCVEIPLPASHAEAHTALRVNPCDALAYAAVAAWEQEPIAVPRLSPLALTGPPETPPALAALRTIELLI